MVGLSLKLLSGIEIVLFNEEGDSLSVLSLPSHVFFDEVILISYLPLLGPILCLEREERLLENLDLFVSLVQVLFNFQPYGFVLFGCGILLRLDLFLKELEL